MHHIICQIVLDKAKYRNNILKFRQSSKELNFNSKQMVKTRTNCDLHCYWSALKGVIYAFTKAMRVREHGVSTGANCPHKDVHTVCCMGFQDIYTLFANILSAKASPKGRILKEASLIQYVYRNCN